MITPKIGHMLTGLGCNNFTATTGSAWRFVNPGLHIQEGLLSVHENYLMFLSSPLLSSDPWAIVRQNHNLGPALRLVLDRTGRCRLAGETLLVPSHGGEAKLEQKIHILFDSFAAGLWTVSENRQGKKPQDHFPAVTAGWDFRTLAEELDRPVQAAEQELLFDCSTAKNAHQVSVRLETGMLMASVEMAKAESLSIESLNALSLMLLLISSRYRLARATACASEYIVFSVQVPLFPSASVEEVEAALNCLSLLAGSCLDEAVILQQSNTAKTYLAVCCGEIANAERR